MSKLCRWRDARQRATKPWTKKRLVRVLQSKSILGVPGIDPAEMAPVVVFLASDAARMVSGATYDVTGGDSANNV